MQWSTWATYPSGLEEQAAPLIFSLETGRCSEKESSTWTLSSARAVEGSSSLQTQKLETRSARFSLPVRKRTSWSVLLVIKPSNQVTIVLGGFFSPSRLLQV